MATKVMDCDLVVLGAGGSGLVAAVKAADVSGKKVIVLEKARKVGGATIFAHGFNPSDTTWEKEAGYPVGDPPDISGQFFDWLVGKGGVDKYFRMAKEGERKMGGAGSVFMPERTEKYRDLPDPSIGPGWWGTVVVDKMMDCCEKSGIPVLTETRARKFITDKDGRVTGVIADTRGGQLLVNCSACVIAAGGFGANYEKLQKYWPEEFNNKQLFSLCPPASTGDCIDMAEGIGAALDQTKWAPSSFPRGFMSRTPIHHPYSYSIMNIMGDGRMLSVNLNAERWYNEGGGGMFSDASVASQPDAVAYYITNDEIIDEVGPTLADNVMDASDIAIVKNYRADIAYEVQIDEEGASGDHAKKADTFAELALKMKIDPARFVATMERYNRFCDEGKDPEFGKDPKYLVPIRKPPFYAFFGHRFSQCTKGMNGVAVNPNFEVLDKEGEVMPGLWAAGDGCTIFGGTKRPTMFAPPQGGMPGATGSAMPAATGSSPGGETAGAAAGPEGGGAPPEGGMPPGGGMPPDGGMPGGTGGTGGPGGPQGASSGSTNILSTEAIYNDGLTNALLSGYQVGISAGNYLKNL